MPTPSFFQQPPLDLQVGEESEIQESTSHSNSMPLILR